MITPQQARSEGIAGTTKYKETAQAIDDELRLAMHNNKVGASFDVPDEFVATVTYSYGLAWNVSPVSPGFHDNTTKLKFSPK